MPTTSPLSWNEIEPFAGVTGPIPADVALDRRDGGALVAPTLGVELPLERRSRQRDPEEGAYSLGVPLRRARKAAGPPAARSEEALSNPRRSYAHSPIDEVDHSVVGATVETVRLAPASNQGFIGAISVPVSRWGLRWAVTKPESTAEPPRGLARRFRLDASVAAG